MNPSLQTLKNYKTEKSYKLTNLRFVLTFCYSFISFWHHFIFMEIYYIILSNRQMYGNFSMCHIDAEWSAAGDKRIERWVNKFGAFERVVKRNPFIVYLANWTTRGYHCCIGNSIPQQYCPCGRNFNRLKFKIVNQNFLNISNMFLLKSFFLITSNDICCKF